MRTLLLLAMQCIALIIDSHEKFGLFDYYRNHAIMGEMHIGDLYDAVDIELEAYNILAQVIAFGLYSLGQPIFVAQVRKSKIISREGSSCSLCFKRRTSEDDKDASSTIKSNWVEGCNRIRDQCEQLARDEAAKIANRVANNANVDRDAFSFMF